MVFDLVRKVVGTVCAVEAARRGYDAFNNSSFGGRVIDSTISTIAAGIAYKCFEPDLKPNERGSRSIVHYMK